MTTAITYRKTKSGEWVAFGPAAVLPNMRSTKLIDVSRRDGGIDRWYVARIGREFQVNGVAHAYAYLDQKAGKLASFGPTGRTVRTTTRCTCRCHTEAHAGAAGTTLYDGCDRCGCQSA